MPALFRSRHLLTASAAVALLAGFAVAGATPVSAVDTHPPLTVSKTTAHSGLDHGDEIDESGDGCVDSTYATGIVMWLAKGVVDDSEPINTDLTAFGYSALPDAGGHWSGGFTISGGSADFALAPGLYTLRTECDAGPFTKFIYAGVVITITDGDAGTTTTTADPGTTTTTTGGATTTTVAGSTTTAAPATTATPAAAVAAQATFTG